MEWRLEKRLMLRLVLTALQRLSASRENPTRQHASGRQALKRQHILTLLSAGNRQASRSENFTEPWSKWRKTLCPYFDNDVFAHLTQSLNTRTHRIHKFTSFTSLKHIHILFTHTDMKCTWEQRTFWPFSRWHGSCFWSPPCVLQLHWLKRKIYTIITGLSDTIDAVIKSIQGMRKGLYGSVMHKILWLCVSWSIGHYHKRTCVIIGHCYALVTVIISPCNSKGFLKNLSL